MPWHIDVSSRQSRDRKMIPVRNINDSENTGDLLACDQQKTKKAFY